MKKAVRKPQRAQPAAPAPALTEKQLNRIAVAVLFFLPFVFYWKYLTGSPMLFGTDWLGSGSLVMRDWMTGYIKSHGSLAYWMPAILSGQPTGAAFFADLFYPTGLARLVLPIQVVWTWTFVLHIFLAGLGTYLFLKELKVSVLPAALGGIAYMFAGSLISLTYAGHDGRLIGSALMPLALLFLHRGMTRRRLFWFLLTGLVMALQLLSGHLQKVYYTGIILTAYFLFLLIVTIRREKSGGLAARLCVYFVIGIGISLALAAIQYLPIISNLPYAARGAGRGYEYASSWSMPLAETFDLLTPRFSGGLEHYWSKNPFKLHTEYLGIIPLLFAAVAVFRRWKDRNVKFFFFLFVGVLLMAWGGNTPFYRIPYHLFPGVAKFRGPAMIFFLGAFSLAALAGLGIDYLVRPAKPGAKQGLKTALWFGAVPLVLLLAFALLREPVMSLLRSLTLPQRAEAVAANFSAMTGGLLFATVVAGIGILLVWAVSRQKLRAEVFAVLAAAVMVLDVGLSLKLWSDTGGYIRGVPPPEQYFAADEAASFLSEDTTLYRVLPLNYDHSDDGLLMYHGIQSAGGQIPNPLQNYQDFIGAGQSVMFSPGNLLNPGFMNVLNLKYVVSPSLPEDVSGFDPRSQQAIAQLRAWLGQPWFEPAFIGQRYSVYENRSVLPRAFLAPGYEVVKDKDELLARLSREDFDPAATVLLYESPGFTPVADSVPGIAEIESYDCDRIAVKANAPSPRLLVLSDNYYPDWQATVDGKPAPILQAYHTLRAVELGPGEHEVIFRYNPKYYSAGALVSLAALLFLVGICAVGIARSRRRAGPEPR